MLPEGKALLQACYDNPGDDTPRLVFADWLQENGEEVAAEFIRKDIELARMDPNDPRYKKTSYFRAKLNVLRTRTKQAWGRIFAEDLNLEEAVFCDNINMERGIPISFSLMAHTFTNSWQTIPKIPPFSRVDLNALRNNNGEPMVPYSDIAANLQGITWLRLGPKVPNHQFSVLPELITAIAAAPAASDLNTLILQSIHESREPLSIGDGGATAIANSPHLGNLRELILFNQEISDPGAIALAGSQLKLTLLDLTGDNEIGAVGAMALMASPAMRQTRIVFAENPIMTEQSAAAAAVRSRLTPEGIRLPGTGHSYD